MFYVLCFKQDVIKGIVLDSATIKIKLTEGAEMPVYLVVKGVPGDMERVARWELDFPDKPSICYKCYQVGHWRRECKNPSVPISALLARTDMAEGGMKGLYAQVVRSKEAKEAEEKKKKTNEKESERSEVEIHEKMVKKCERKS